MSIELPSEAEVRAVTDGFTFPEAFDVGSATAGYQCEGGYNVGDGPRNNWAEWESRPGNERTGPCARFWDLPERDYGLAKGLGLNAHRLSVEWARVQPVRERVLPETPPPWDERALDRYVELLIQARKHGLEPYVTLLHFAHPYWLGVDFWLQDDAPMRFARYAGAVVASLNERLLDRGEQPIKQVITLNEPYVLAVGTYLGRWMPSDEKLDLGSPARVARCLDGQYAGHIRAYHAIHDWYAARGLAKPVVTFNNFALDFYGGDRFFVDLMLSRSRDIPWGPQLRRHVQEREAAFDDAMQPLTERSRAKAPERWLIAGTARTLAMRLFRPERYPRIAAALWSSDHVRPLDAIAIDYYDPTSANQLRFAAGYEPWEWEAIPEGLFHMLVLNGRDGLPVYVAENGMATRRPIGGRSEPRPDGTRRDEFLRAHLFQLVRALKAGVNVTGYLFWSLTDNYEWGRFSPRFGLFGVEYEKEERSRLATDASGVDAASVLAAFAKALAAKDSAALAASLLPPD